MHWTRTDKEKPIRWPFSMYGFATIEVPGCLPRVHHGEFHMGQDIWNWHTDPKPYMVRRTFSFYNGFHPKPDEVVFCENTGHDEESYFYFVYPEKYITAWMNEPGAYREECDFYFNVDVDGYTYTVEMPEYPYDTKLSEHENYEKLKIWLKERKEIFLKNKGE